MLQHRGRIISGEFDLLNETFHLQTVKHLTTSSTIGKNQMEMLYRYLMNQNDDDSQVISLEDQLLLRLSRSEIDDLKIDLNEVINQLNSSS